MAVLITGNILSLLSSVCILISVTVKSKKSFIKWEIFNIIFYILACVALSAYAALVSMFIALIRDVLAYKDYLTKFITFILCLLIVIAGVWVNNRGLIGVLPIVAITGYTISIYLTKNEQQLRYAMVVNMLLWLVHNLFIKAYPSAVLNIVICFWTALNIIKNRKKFDLLKK